jgi:hypothetical protein
MKWMRNPYLKSHLESHPTAVRNVSFIPQITTILRKDGFAS